MNIFFLEVESEDCASVKARFPEAQIFEGVLSEKEITEQCQEAEVLCCFIYSPITRKVIESLPHLKMIITRSVGYDHIDLKAAAEKNVAVCHVPDYGAHVIAEHVFALLLSTVRCVIQGEERTQQCHFDFHGLRGMALRGKTLGLIGTGKIGKIVARIASLGFLMKVVAYDPYPNKDAALDFHFSYESLEEVLAQSDVLSLHCPLLDSTRHLIDTKAIAQMKEGVCIVNTSRGEILDTTALIAGLKSGKISRAALDVLEHEKNLKKHEEIFQLPNVTITPHIAFYADDSMKKMYEESFLSLERFLQGKELVHRVKGI